MRYPFKSYGVSDIYAINQFTDCWIIILLVTLLQIRKGNYKCKDIWPLQPFNIFTCDFIHNYIIKDNLCPLLSLY